MIAETDLPPWAAILVSLCMLGGAAITLIGAIGLMRFKRFYDRVHAPTLGATIGTGLILIGSMICFSVLETRPILHEILIGVFTTITTPVTLILLVRAALYRDRVEKNDVPIDE
ncbi:MAG: monovalent cation/H(+) antiporter subunit G [Terricaulis sp.]|nr:monovalent cation/H(+) antiporter subunit G [Terricaulis sp.]